MELNAEINKVFGQEMAKLFAAQISEEEMMKKANEAWQQLNHRESSYWDTKDSEINKLIKKICTDRLKEQIEEVTSTDTFKEQMATLAQQMVDEIVDETHKKIVAAVSDRMASMTAGYGGYGLKDMIANVVAEMINR